MVNTFTYTVSKTLVSKKAFMDRIVEMIPNTTRISDYKVSFNDFNATFYVDNDSLAPYFRAGSTIASGEVTFNNGGDNNTVTINYCDEFICVTFTSGYPVVFAKFKDVETQENKPVLLFATDELDNSYDINTFTRLDSKSITLTNPPPSIDGLNLCVLTKIVFAFNDKVLQSQNIFYFQSSNVNFSTTGNTTINGEKYFILRKTSLNDSKKYAVLKI